MGTDYRIEHINRDLTYFNTSTQSDELILSKHYLDLYSKILECLDEVPTALENFKILNRYFIVLYQNQKYRFRSDLNDQVNRKIRYDLIQPNQIKIYIEQLSTPYNTTNFSELYQNPDVVIGTAGEGYNSNGVTIFDKIHGFWIKEIQSNYILLEQKPNRIANFAVGAVINATDTKFLQQQINRARVQCLCNCNFCSCDCNYCSCNCNYCSCNCNYCTCNCNYRSGTVIQKICNCNCNYCACNCNFEFNYN